jgi:hypothetical protein
MNQPRKLAQMPGAKNRKLVFACGPGWHLSMLPDHVSGRRWREWTLLPTDNDFHSSFARQATVREVCLPERSEGPSVCLRITRPYREFSPPTPGAHFSRPLREVGIYVLHRFRCDLPVMGGARRSPEVESGLPGSPALRYSFMHVC